MSGVKYLQKEVIDKIVLSFKEKYGDFKDCISKEKFKKLQKYTKFAFRPRFLQRE
jgi:hypothetical protein